MSTRRHVLKSMSLGAAMAIAGLTGGCDPPGAPRQAEVGARGKRGLFGDPALVPTRAGERARAELALADAIAQALQVLGAEALAVEVRLPGGDDPGAVVVAGQGPPGWDEDEAQALVRELCGPWSAGVTRVAWRGAVADAARVRGLGLPLGCALLGLGASAGVTVERLRRRRTRAPALRA